MTMKYDEHVKSSNSDTIIFRESINKRCNTLYTTIDSCSPTVLPGGQPHVQGRESVVICVLPTCAIINIPRQLQMYFCMTTQIGMYGYTNMECMKQPKN